MQLQGSEIFVGRHGSYLKYPIAIHVLFTSKGVTCLKQTAETKDQNGNMMHFKVQGMLRNCAWQPWDLVPA